MSPRRGRGGAAGSRQKRIHGASQMSHGFSFQHGVLGAKIVPSDAHFSTGFEKTLHVARTFGESQLGSGGRWHVNGGNRARSKVVDQMAQNDAVGEASGDLERIVG